jgi:hypothetical protein
LRQQKDRLERNNIEVIVVTFEQEENALNYRQETELDWPLVVDCSKEIYRYYGMGKAGFWDLWGPASWRVYFREILKGNRPRPANDDIYQRGGDVLINPEGMVRLHHISKGPADRPRVDSILQIVEGEDSRAKLHDGLYHLKN